eukprot:3356886-Pyramimonas_sp.AAC.2
MAIPSMMTKPKEEPEALPRSKSAPAAALPAGGTCDFVMNSDTAMNGELQLAYKTRTNDMYYNCPPAHARTAPPHCTPDFNPLHHTHFSHRLQPTSPYTRALQLYWSGFPAETG